jgi:hypothetical protein
VHSVLSVHLDANRGIVAVDPADNVTLETAMIVQMASIVAPPRQVTT